MSAFGGDVGVVKTALLLEFACSADAPPHLGGRCSAIFSAELLVRYSGRLEVRIDAVKQEEKRGALL